MTFAPEPDAFTVAWICPMKHEAGAARAAFKMTYRDDSDEYKIKHEINRATDWNTYYFGRIGSFDVVVCLPHGTETDGQVAAADAWKNLVCRFTSIKYLFLIGIAGGVPNLNPRIDVRCGDVVIGLPKKPHPGVKALGQGKKTDKKIVKETAPLKAPHEDLKYSAGRVIDQLKDSESGENLVFQGLRNEILQNLPRDVELPHGVKWQYPGEDLDVWFNADYSCESERNNSRQSSDWCPAHCSTDRRINDRLTRQQGCSKVHGGLIASTHIVIESAQYREKKVDDIYKDCDRGEVLCFEMEGAALARKTECLQVRGICDYCDSHKTKVWQGYAAIQAAVVATLILLDMTQWSKPRSRQPSLITDVFDQNELERSETLPVRSAASVRGNFQGVGDPRPRRNTDVGSDSMKAMANRQTVRAQRSFKEVNDELEQSPVSGDSSSRRHPTSTAVAIVDEESSETIGSSGTRPRKASFRRPSLESLSEESTESRGHVTQDHSSATSDEPTAICPVIPKFYSCEGLSLTCNDQNLCSFELEITGPNSDDYMAIPVVRTYPGSGFPRFDGVWDISPCSIPSGPASTGCSAKTLTFKTESPNSGFLQFWIPADNVTFSAQGEDHVFEWSDCEAFTLKRKQVRDIARYCYNPTPGFRNIKLRISFRDRAGSDIFRQQMLHSKLDVSIWDTGETETCQDSDKRALTLYRRNQNAHHDKQALVTLQLFSDETETYKLFMLSKSWRIVSNASNSSSELIFVIEQVHTLDYHTEALEKPTEERYQMRSIRGQPTYDQWVLRDAGDPRTTKGYTMDPKLKIQLSHLKEFLAVLLPREKISCTEYASIKWTLRPMRTRDKDNCLVYCIRRKHIVCFCSQDRKWYLFEVDAIKQQKVENKTIELTVDGWKDAEELSLSQMESISRRSATLTIGFGCREDYNAIKEIFA